MKTRRKGPPYRAALAGCGRVGFLLEQDPLRPKPCTHAGALAGHPHFQLVAGCDIQPARLEKFGETYGIGPENLYLGVDDMIQSEDLDVLSVATWTESHDGIVREACRAGIPAVVCEKPMAVTFARAREMMSVARRSGTMLIINHSRRWSPEYRSVRQAIESGRYGRLRQVQGCVLTSFGLTAPRGRSTGVNWHEQIEKSGGGPLLHDGTHLIDIVLYLTGWSPAWVDTRLERHPGCAVEHRITGRMGFRQDPDVEFSFEAGGAREYFHFEVELWFDAGRITVGNGICRAEGNVSSRRYSGFRDLSPDAEFPWMPAIGTAEQVSMKELSEWFSSGVKPNNRASEAILSQEAIFAAYESAVLGRRVAIPYRPATAEHPLMHGLSVRAKKTVLHAARKKRERPVRRRASR